MLSRRVQRCLAFSVFTNSRSISARDATLCKVVRVHSKIGQPGMLRTIRSASSLSFGSIIQTNARSPTGRPKSKGHLTDSMAAAGIPAAGIPAVGIPAVGIPVAADIAVAVVWWPRP